MSNLKQYIADIYHCSDSWGIKMTEDDMYLSLIEWNKETESGEYCPQPYQYRQCARYWNKLCDLYPI